MFTCKVCTASFNTELALTIHHATVHAPQFKCTKCGEGFNREYCRKRHEASCGDIFICKVCGQLFSNMYNGKRHEEMCGKVKVKVNREEPSKDQLLALPPGEEGVTPYETGFDNRLKSYLLRSDKCFDLDCYLTDNKDKMKELISRALTDLRLIKVNIVVECTFVNALGESRNDAFKTKNWFFTKTSDIDDLLTKKFKKIKTEMEESQLKGSGWKLFAVDGIRLRINKYNPLRGSSFIPLPNKIEARKVCINVQNQDEECFKYAILAPLVEAKNAGRVSKYKYLTHTYDFSSISFPTPTTDIEKFERRNNISINLFALDEKDNVYPMKVVKKELEDHRDLLLLTDETGRNHYVYIKNFNRLVRSQITKYQHKIEICKRCFTHFDDRYGATAEEKLKEHQRLCGEENPAVMVMPSKNPITKFKAYNKLVKLPVVIYADFESILEPNQGCQPDPSHSFTTICQNHIPMSFGIYVKTEILELQSDPIIYEGPDAAEKFMSTLIDIARKIEDIYRKNIPMTPLTEDQEHKFNQITDCELCRKPFTEEDWKVADHCHITGKYRQALHNSCNLLCRTPNYIPVVLHNLSGYDSHFIVKQLGCNSEEVEVIPNNTERYISFTKHVGGVKLRFIDSFRFMASSLDKLVSYLPSHPETAKYFKEKSSLMTRKGVFPYEYVDSWDRLKDTSLPPKAAFFSKLNESGISDEDYQHAQNVWQAFNLKTLSDYAQLYLKSDVLLLCDVFEAFRESMIKTHRVDPAHYFTAPGLTWDAMLLFTGIELELLQNYDQILMVENGIRGGLCQVSHRYAEANNKYMATYDPSKPSSYITYEDCNNQYGWAMSQPLPYGGFKWTDPADINLDLLGPEDEDGYILEADIEYPAHLHPLHNSFPFLPENIAPQGMKKLIPHLGERKLYVLHYMILKQALDHGLKLKKIHRALQFKQSRWLQPYIELNNNLRKQASNDFEKNLYKLLNNSCYGKTLERVKNRCNIQLVTDAKKFEKLVAKPTFLDRTIYGENLVAVHMAKTKVVLDKPIYIGLCVLELSKQLMYKFHYDVLLPYYGPERLSLLYTDTDSFIYLIKTEDMYKDRLDRLDYLDTSNLPPELAIPSVNKGVLGLFKDEVEGKPIKRFIGLRAKMYALDVEGQEETKKVKGIGRSAVKNHITFNSFVEVLESNSPIFTAMSTIRSYKHDVKTIKLNKVSLSPFDDKRVIMEDGISTRAYGYID